MGVTQFGVRRAAMGSKESLKEGDRTKSITAAVRVGSRGRKRERGLGVLRTRNASTTASSD